MKAGKGCIVTGGAGFIGCAISAGLVDRFDNVIAFDVLHPQIHPLRERPQALAKGVELLVADVTDPAAWDALIADVLPDTIIHLAAETGTGQSLTESTRHAHVNVTGTAAMLDALTRAGHVPRQFLLAGSRAVYGEGPWYPSQEPLPEKSADLSIGKIHQDNRLEKGSDSTKSHDKPEAGVQYPGQRSREQLARGQWDFPGLSAGLSRADITTPRPVSIYGATKLAQENMLKAWTAALGAGITILRLQNVYGPGQALANAYTGIVCLFCRLARAGLSIPLYEDGEMLRNFIFIDDVSAAILQTLDRSDAGSHIFDIGTGSSARIGDIAGIIAAHYGAPPPHVCGKYRFGDIRHAICDVGPAVEVLKWRAAHGIVEGIAALAAWIETQLPPAERGRLDR